MKDDRLQSAVDSITVPAYMTRKSQIVDYFKQEYAGKPDSTWRSRAAEIISGTSDKKSTAYKSARRQFEGERLYKEPTKEKAKEAITDLGKALPSVGVKPTKDTITITVKGDQKVVRNGRAVGTRERTIEVTMSGSQAYDFVNNPSYEDIYDEYGVEPDLFIDDPDYELSVSGVSIG